MMTMNTRLLLLLAVPALLIGACRSPAPDQYEDVGELDKLPEDPYVYTLNPGDLVQVEIAEDDQYEWETEVLPDGSATFRWAGELDVMGLTLRETRELLKVRLKRYYNDPTMTLYLKRVNGPKPIVFLGNFGEVSSGNRSAGSGGVVPYRKGIGVLETIAVAGGIREPNYDLAPYIYIVRNPQSIKDRTTYRFDFSEAVVGNIPDLPLHPGDIIFLDQSWLQDMERAIGVYSKMLGSTTNALGSALLIDTIADGGLVD